MVIKNRNLLKSKKSYSGLHFEDNYSLQLKCKRSNSHLHFEDNYSLQLKCKRSQVTVFVIIAIVMIAAIAGTFMLIKRAGTVSLSPAENPNEYMQDCMKKAADTAIVKIIPSGGLINQNKYFLFNKTQVTYICYTMLDKELCTNEHPMLTTEIQNQIIEEIKPKVEKCFAVVADALSSYDYQEASGELTAEISPSLVKIKSAKKISYNKDENAVSIEGFSAQINSALWDFSILSGKIANAEVNCNCGEESCNADVLKLSLANPDYELDHFVAGSGEEVYSIREILTGKVFNIAFRNCVKGEPEIFLP